MQVGDGGVKMKSASEVGEQAVVGGSEQKVDQDARECAESKRGQVQEVVDKLISNVEDIEHGEETVSSADHGAGATETTATTQDGQVLGGPANPASEDPRKSLREELQKRRPSVYRVRKSCKTGLNGRIPKAMRADVWQLLLGVESKDRFLLDDSIRDTKQDLDNQRVIRVDALRTRADVPAFRSEEMQTLVSKLLTFYCKRKAIRYKQGLNEVLAPFIMLRRDPALPDGTIFNMFYAFIDRFLPHMYVHEEFHALQCSFRLFRLLLQYHDPELCNHLDTHNLSPELYATPWFLTLFARNVPLDSLYELWDCYLLEEGDGGSQLHMYVALALLEQNRVGILSTHPSDLPIYLTSVLGPATDGRDEDFDDTHRTFLVESVGKVIEQAKTFMGTTPRAFNDAISRTTLLRKCPSFHEVERLEAQPCLYISASQVIQLLTNKSRTRAEDMVIQIVDCRSKENFEDNHLVGSIHLDPGLLNLPELLETAMGKLAERCEASAAVTIHLVLVGDQPPPMSAMTDESAADEKPAPGVDQECTMFLLHAMQRSFRRVSCVQGGFPEIERVVEDYSEPVMENGPAMDPLVHPLTPKQRSTTLDTLKDAIIGGIATTKETLHVDTNSAAEKPSSRGSSRASSPSSWMQRIGKSLGDAPSSIGGLFSSSKDSKDGDTTGSLPESLSIRTASSVSSTSSLSSTKTEFDAAVGDDGQQHPSLMSRVATKWKLPFDFSSKVGKTDCIKDENGSRSLEEVISQQEGDDENWVNLASVLHNDETVKVYKARHVKKTQPNVTTQTKCLVVVSSSYVVHFKRHPDRANFAMVREKYLIRDLIKITSKKSIHDLVVFHFKHGITKQNVVKSSFVVEQSKDCIEKVKANYNSAVAS